MPPRLDRLDRDRPRRSHHPHRRRTTLVAAGVGAVLAALFASPACGGRASPGLDGAAADGGNARDARGDAAADIALDRPQDGATDTATDPTLDTAIDAALDGPKDALADTTADAADANPACPPAIVEDEPCETEGQSCGGPCTDVCSFCNLFICESGAWQRVEVFPAPCFDCGPDLRCQQDVTYCERVGSDVVGVPDTFRCVDAPESCGGSASCECLEAEKVFFSECNEATPGQVTIIVPGG